MWRDGVRFLGISAGSAAPTPIKDALCPERFPDGHVYVDGDVRPTAAEPCPVPGWGSPGDCAVDKTKGHILLHVCAPGNTAP